MQLTQFYSVAPMTYAPMTYAPMTSPALLINTLEPLAVESQAVQFFHDSVGKWRSERRYYTLKSGLIQEVVSDLSVAFLGADCEDLLALSALHGDRPTLVCGLRITWDSHYAGPSQKSIQGETIFGLRGDLLYRDRGFATDKPITGNLQFPNPRTMVLRTEYDGSAFEEEVKLISDRYRTRQTIISRAGEEQMIGQYLERRIVD
jgi:CpeS-like protein